MPTHRFNIRVTLVIAFEGLAGCSQTAYETVSFPTVADVKRFAAEEQKLHQAHAEDMTRQHLALQPAAGPDILGSTRQFQSQSAEVADRVARMESTLQPLIEMGMTGVLQFVGRLSGVDAPLTEMLGRQQSAVEAVADQMRQAALARTLSERDLEAMRTTVSGFDSKLRSLVESVADPVQMKSAIIRHLAESGLSPGTIARLTQADDGEFYELLGVLFGAGGMGALFSRLGRSRSQQDIEKLKERVNGINGANGGNGAHSA